MKERQTRKNHTMNLQKCVGALVEQSKVEANENVREGENQQRTILHSIQLNFI